MLSDNVLYDFLIWLTLVMSRVVGGSNILTLDLRATHSLFLLPTKDN